MTTITKEQYEDIKDAYLYGSKNEFHEQLKKHTGIVAVPYTAYSYYDDGDNYIGDSDNYSLKDLLENAYIEIEEESD